MTTTTDTTTLFTNYLNTCNAALERHRDAFPFKQLLRGGEKLLEDKNIGVAVYTNKTPGSEPHDYFTMRLHDGHFELVGHGKVNVDVGWKTSEEYLEKVAENPDEYIEHPTKLDLDWLKSRLGIN